MQQPEEDVDPPIHGFPPHYRTTPSPRGGGRNISSSSSSWETRKIRPLDLEGCLLLPLPDALLSVLDNGTEECFFTTKVQVARVRFTAHHFIYHWRLVKVFFFKGSRGFFGGKSENVWSSSAELTMWSKDLLARARDVWGMVTAKEILFCHQPWKVLKSAQTAAMLRFVINSGVKLLPITTLPFAKEAKCMELQLKVS